MKFSTSLSTVLALSGTTFAAALPKRTIGTVTDADVLNYALTLEHLEDKFYRDGLANFTQKQFADAGFDATFYQNLKEISYDETTHVSFLTSALTGMSPTRMWSMCLALIVRSCWRITSNGMQVRLWRHLGCFFRCYCFNP
jgi:hypothetical protein